MRNLTIYFLFIEMNLKFDVTTTQHNLRKLTRFEFELIQTNYMLVQISTN